MKNYLLILATALILFAGTSIAGAAPTYSITPADTWSAAVGDTVSFDIMFNADADGDTLRGVSLNLGYDAAELSFVSVSYDTLEAQGWLEQWGPLEDVTLAQGSFLLGFNLDYNWYSSDAYDVGANQSVSVGTFTFQVTSGLVQDNNFDLWVEDSLDLGEQGIYSSKITFNDIDDEYVSVRLLNQGADVAPVPVPSALLLMAAGMVALAGARRKEAC